MENLKSPGKFTEILTPLCSDVGQIGTVDLLLKIVDVSEIFIPLEGAKKLIILCNEITPEDIAVRFHDGVTANPWQVIVKPSYVHENCALVLTTPPYLGGGVQRQSIQVFMTLFRPSDGKSSKPEVMYFVPSDVGSNGTMPPRHF